MRFETEQWLPYPVEQVFAFFANPANLPPLMPSWQKARIDAVAFRPPPALPNGADPVAGIFAGNGTELMITARPLPFSPFRAAWLARIEDFRGIEGFCDVQLKGPFRYWRHCHSVRESVDPARGNGTIVRDQVEYELPVLSAAAWVDHILVRPQLRTLFRYRQKRAETLINSRVNLP